MLSIKNICKTYNSGLKPALNNINIKIREGDFCIILGTNGSGKSTLLKTILGEAVPSKGDIVINGKSILNENIQKRSSYISSIAQDINKGTISGMTLLENIQLSTLRGKNAKLKLYQNNISAIETQVKKLDLNLEQYLNTNIELLSGGQRQAIASLMAVTNIPKILLMDEHTSALDTITKNKIMHFLNQQIIAANITCLMITHDLKDALKYGNRLIIMKNGTISHDFTREEKNNLQEDDLIHLLHDHEA